jgi:hypothetical protein
MRGERDTEVYTTHQVSALEALAEQNGDATITCEGGKALMNEIMILTSSCRIHFFMDLWRKYMHANC